MEAIGKAKPLAGAEGLQDEKVEVACSRVHYASERKLFADADTATRYAIDKMRAYSAL